MNQGVYRLSLRRILIGVKDWPAASFDKKLFPKADPMLAPHIRKLPLVPERDMGSFAGGLAVAYVFLHLLPEIAAGNEAIGEALSDVLEPTPLLELAIFLVALTGWSDTESRRKSAEAGIDHHLNKPIELDVLLKLLRT